MLKEKAEASKTEIKSSRNICISNIPSSENIEIVGVDYDDLYQVGPDGSGFGGGKI